MIKKVIITLAALGFLVVTSCNTVSGVGQDVKKVGNKIENVAN